MIRGAITSYIDVAQIVLYAFFAFFACLIWYLRREDRREGYPLETEAVGWTRDRGFLFIPPPKKFNLAHGVTVVAPRFDVDERAHKVVKTAPWPGAPFEPVGDPMLAAVGPGAYALRADVAERTFDGRDLIVPTRIATNYAVASEEANPIGMKVIGADRKVGGVIVDLWVDRGEHVLRYFEVETETAPLSRRVLLPVTFSNVDGRRRRVQVDAILGSQFGAVPATSSPDKVTMLEEEKIVAYYGGGTLYATPGRAGAAAMKAVNLELLLPSDIPSGEHILWHGRPDWFSLTRKAFRADFVAGYFGLMTIVNFGITAGTSDLSDAVISAAKTVAAGCVALSLLMLLAWLSSRTTLYVVTSRRVTMKIGVALPIFFNLPFASIASASFRPYADGTGEIPLSLAPGTHIAYLHLWPHARPFHLARPEPTLRCVPNGARVAEVLSRALLAASNEAHATIEAIEPHATAPVRYPENVTAAA